MTSSRVKRPRRYPLALVRRELGTARDIKVYREVG